MHPQNSQCTPPVCPQGCSRHLLLAVRLVNRARGHEGLLEALHAVLHGATHVPAHYVGAPVPVEEKNRIIRGPSTYRTRGFKCNIALLSSRALVMQVKVMLASA